MIRQHLKSDVKSVKSDKLVHLWNVRIILFVDTHLFMLDTYYKYRERKKKS